MREGGRAPGERERGCGRSALRLLLAVTMLVTVALGDLPRVGGGEVPGDVAGRVSGGGSAGSAGSALRLFHQSAQGMPKAADLERPLEDSEELPARGEASPRGGPQSGEAPVPGSASLPRRRRRKDTRALREAPGLAS